MLHQLRVAEPSEDVRNGLAPENIDPRLPAVQKIADLFASSLGLYHEPEITGQEERDGQGNSGCEATDRSDSGARSCRIRIQRGRTEDVVHAGIEAERPKE